ncbi:calcium:proton antiporter [Pseudomonas sp. GV071]|jgi:Ca2+:H+ antiporter|uniref:calcium:proton antiporter n=1 Tax=Pseudomonas sp. GV071 TaxID=2135754 RepID=UPI000D338FB3|nr:calcium:proton antiporter [Pseudomonas sp. GV071]PTQ67417.1 Ca2+:H+ antiporter [Pseudomonas sp. GV071]
MLAHFKDEKLLLIAIAAVAIAYPLEHALLHSGQGVALVGALALVGAIICASMRVAHHAELLAHRVGDPYGTMILTLAAVLVEVVVLAIMMSNEASPTLVRDTIYSAVMLDINGILGLAALMGGIKHGEQPYNDDSAKSYSVMILTAMGISMVVPEFVPEGSWKAYSAFTVVMMIMLYALFLRMQVGPHSYFFSYAYPEKRRANTEEEQHDSKAFSIAMLVLGVIVIGALAEVMSKALDLGLEGTGAPPVLAALLVAAISAAPEILTALRAAMANRMQSVVNIALGASLSTVILTVPVMEGIALYTGQPFLMAMTPIQSVMVFITLIVAAINLNDGETNAIEGMTHFALFATFLMLTFIGL